MSRGDCSSGCGTWMVAVDHGWRLAILPCDRIGEKTTLRTPYCHGLLHDILNSSNRTQPARQ
jgi:hypothetical protein